MRCAAAIRAGYKSSLSDQGSNANKSCLLQKHLREVQAEQRIARLVPT